jgi:hypothetical protein
MSEDPEGRPPAGEAEPVSVDVGEPTRATRGEGGEERRPDLDERESRISTERKPMGPPLQDPEAPPESDFERRERGPAERPVDPDD